MTEPDSLRQQQIDYYRARATEYDDWHQRRGRYDRGEALNRQWFAEVEEVSAALDAAEPRGRVLELACGTGWWTQRLARAAEHVTAVDASPEVLAINRRRLAGERVDYVQADVFVWQPDGVYDFVFFSFWLSHVPPERFGAFWDLVDSCLAPGGRMFFIDSLYDPLSPARGHELPERNAVVAVRRLNDGREFQIVKLFYEPAELAGRLRTLGWDVAVSQTAHHFLYGSGGRL